MPPRTAIDNFAGGQAALQASLGETRQAFDDASTSAKRFRIESTVSDYQSAKTEKSSTRAESCRRCRS